MKVKNHPTQPKDYVRLFSNGFAMGSVDVIPGVSGGTMAFILGIYEDLLDGIKSFDITLLKLLSTFKLKEAMDHVPWQFLLSLFIGIGVAVLTLAHAISWMLDNQPVYLFSFFFGLILASILAIGSTIEWSPRAWAMLAVGTAVGLSVVHLVPLDMPHDPLTLFLSGMVAIVAMILPGISGSFLLLILGQYDFVLEAVKELNILAIIPVGVGAVVGLAGFSRVLSWLLKRYHTATIAALVGFIIGSLWKIWPWKHVVREVEKHGEMVPIVEHNILPPFASGEFIVALLLCLIGFLVVCIIDHQQSHANPFFRLFGLGQQQTARQ